VERGGAFPFPSSQPVAEGLVARGAFEQAVQEGSQIETGSAGYYRHPSAPRNIGYSLAGQPGVFPGREKLVRVYNIDEVVGNRTPLGHREFGSTDIEMSVYLERVAVDNFPVEFRGDGQCQIALSRPGRTNHRNHGPLRYVTRNRCIAGGLVLFSGQGHLSDTCHETTLYNKKVVFGLEPGAPVGRKKVKTP